MCLGIILSSSASQWRFHAHFPRLPQQSATRQQQHRHLLFQWRSRLALTFNRTLACIFWSLWHPTTTIYLPTYAGSHRNVGKFPSSIVYVPNNLRASTIFGTTPDNWPFPMGLHWISRVVANHGPHAGYTEYCHTSDTICTCEECSGHHTWSWKHVFKSRKSYRAGTG